MYVYIYIYIHTHAHKDMQAFQMLAQSLKDEIKFSNKEMSEAKASLASASEKKASAEGDLSITSKDLSGDTAALSDLHHDCMTKAEDFEAETKSRGEELAALAKAKEIITETTGGADAQSYGLNQVSLLQVRHVYMYTYHDIYIYIHIYIYIYTHIDTHMYVYIYIYIHMYMYMYVYTYMHTYTHIHICR